MSNPSDVGTAAYAAGLLDGEGCIEVGRLRSRQLFVSISQKRPGVLEWLKETFGGCVANPTTKRPTWEWKITDVPAAAFLRLTRPWLRVKAQQAWLAMEYIALKTSYQGRTVPPEELALRDGFHLALQAAKR